MTTQNKLNLYSPNTKLALASEMSDALLAEVTPEDLNKHQDEWDKLEKQRGEDVTNVQSVMIDTLSGLKYMFGDDSKEVKYINRALSKGTTIVDTHYEQFTTPSEVAKMVKDAKLKVGANVSQLGLSETNVDDLNDAIKYLTEIGYVFGRDFTAHNAIEIAETSYMENLVGDDDGINRLLENLETCSKCDYKPTSLDISMSKVNCGCYEGKPVTVSFKTTPPSLKVVGGN